MNWKLNYWTVLFALAVAAMAYHYLAGDTKVESDSAIMELCNGLSNCEPNQEEYQITSDSAARQIERYELAMQEIKGILDNDTNFRSPVNNFILNFVALPRCEMYDMLCAIPNGDVYVYPVIDYDKETRQAQFNIILGDTPYESGGLIKANGREKFFDFGKPCPNVCPPHE